MSELLYLFHTQPIWFYGVVGSVSLIFGSFLNAAIYRIPIMMEREWHRSCQEFAEQNGQTYTQPKKDSVYDLNQSFNLFLPRSQCPHCGHMITALENIPVLSYLWQKGRCKSCNSTISIQYPAIEIFTTLLSLLAAWLFGPSIQTVGLLLFTWALITLAIIDLKTMFLPDMITIPLLWLGIVFNLGHTYTDLTSSVLGAILGYLILWSVYHLFKLIRGKEGMGYGDFKLLAAIGAWGGWEILPFVIFVSALTGAIGGSLSLLLRKDKLSNPTPFGPWLALAGIIALYWKDSVLSLSQQVIAP